MSRGEYPDDWKEIATHVKEDAGWCCVRCGHHNDYDTGYVLTVHHFDGIKSNCARWNLMALCQRCHLSVQARVHPEQGLMVHPSRWAMPYIAGMIEAQRTPTPPTYDLAVWVGEYTEHGLEWPEWAPELEATR